MSATQEQPIESMASADQDQVSSDAPAMQCPPTVSGGQICIRTVTGSALYFSYSENMTVAQLKQDLCDVQNIPVSEQRLIFNAKQLEDNHTLKDCGIVPDSTVHLVLRVKGGI